MSRTIPNVLAERYASPAMRENWSPERRIILERELWIAVMKAQRDLGVELPADAIAAYERVKDTVDLDDIKARERVTRHDVKARIESFCAMVGYEHVHKGMTSRDLTENVEQLQVHRAMGIIRDKAVATLCRWAAIAERDSGVVITARTHNVAAQPTTLGKRWAMFAGEFQYALERLETLIASYPVRGLKGAVGTQLDQMTLLGGGAAPAAELELGILRHLGFSRVWNQVGQVYPRSLDFEVVSALYQLGAAPSSFAKTLRLMAGYDLASEGFAKGQVGSSAMPHKMNSRSCERINGFHTILRGYLTMVEGLAGDQWNEGDVSCSVVRRVALPDAFFAMDGMLETTLVILDQLEVHTDVIARENAYYFPFLCTTTLLMEAVRRGAGREVAHEAIKEHAVATLRDLRTGRISTNDLPDRLAKDTRLGLTRELIQATLDNAASLVGAASEQVNALMAVARS